MGVPNNDEGGSEFPYLDSIYGRPTRSFFLKLVRRIDESEPDVKVSDIDQSVKGPAFVFREVILRRVYCWAASEENGGPRRRKRKGAIYRCRPWSLDCTLAVFHGLGPSRQGRSRYLWFKITPRALFLLGALVASAAVDAPKTRGGGSIHACWAMPKSRQPAT